MFAEEELDLVSIVAPTSLHLPVTLAALRAGANVLVEKPIAATRDEALAMIAAAGGCRPDADGRATSSASTPPSASCAAASPTASWAASSRSTPRASGRSRPASATSGWWSTSAPHDIDVMRYLVGSEPIRIFAETERRIHTEHEDLFNGIMKFANGVIGILDINWLTPTKRRTLTVTGERGMYAADYIAQDLVFYANPDAAQTWQNRGADGFGGADHLGRRGRDDAAARSAARSPWPWS